MKKMLFFILLLILSFSFLPSHALASGIFTSGQTGYDISYPQGSSPILPSSYSFLIISVTDGRAYTNNPYLASQVSLASGKILSLYLNLNAPVGSTVKGNTSTPKSCRKNDKVCQAYNYAYNAATHSFSYAQSKNAVSSMWWLDIETGNSWSSNIQINDATIKGATDYLTQQGETVGIYSSSSMWDSIAGSSFVLSTSTPNWISISDPYHTCTPFTSRGQAWLLQSANGGFDYDTACP